MLSRYLFGEPMPHAGSVSRGALLWRDVGDRKSCSVRPGVHCSSGIGEHAHCGAKVRGALAHRDVCFQ
jgi:hypothetical protein